MIDGLIRILQFFGQFLCKTGFSGMRCACDQKEHRVPPPCFQYSICLENRTKKNFALIFVIKKLLKLKGTKAKNLKPLSLEIKRFHEKKR